MAMLTIDGVQIAEIDAGMAEFLKHVAGGRRGMVLRAEGRSREPISREIRPLAGGALALREYEEFLSVDMELQFYRRTESIENTFARP